MTCAPTFANLLMTYFPRNPPPPKTVTICPLKLERPPVPRFSFETSTSGKTSLLMTRGTKSAFLSDGTSDNKRFDNILQNDKLFVFDILFKSVLIEI